MDYFPESEREGLFPIGRLDKDTVGLLIITDDGNLAFNVANPENRVKKTYRFWAKGSCDEEKLQKLRTGVTISTKNGDITAIGEVKKLADATLRDIAHLLEADRARILNTRQGDVPVSYVEIAITEGKKHQVKKMALAVGLRIVHLERVSISNVSLDESLRSGEFRPLSDTEILSLRNN
jgi:16S rRNA pseudouridine516 synthase